MYDVTLAIVRVTSVGVLVVSNSRSFTDRPFRCVEPPHPTRNTQSRTAIPNANTNVSVNAIHRRDLRCMHNPPALEEIFDNTPRFEG